MSNLKLFPKGEYWTRSSMNDKKAIELADRHYSRQKIGTPQFTPPGRKLILVMNNAVWASVFSKFRKDNLSDGIHCTIFRNESKILSSLLIKEAVNLSKEFFGDLPIYTFIDPSKIRSTNPGCCFFKSGFKKFGFTKKKNLIILKHR